MKLAKCHPDQPSARGSRCLACLKAHTSAQKQALLRKKAAAEGRPFTPRKVTAAATYRHCECGKPAGGRRYCGDGACCPPPPRPRPPVAPCSHCGGPKPRGSGQRRTCSDACAKARIQEVADAASHAGCRSETYRAKRRAENRVKYRRPDKAAVIATLTRHQRGKCAVCNEDGGELGLVLDHDHRTGDPRAMLCIRCNAAFGMMRESPERIRSLHIYAIRCGQVGLRVCP